MRGIDDLQEIGRGGTAIVYRGTQSAFGRTVAVKVLDLAVGKDIDRERFRRECRAIGSLSGHPNIVSVYDEGVLDDGRPYIVMEDLTHSLADQLADRGALDWQSAIAIAIALAGALRSAHDSGVLHRDVKPENILISRHGVPKLSDFGLAQVSGGFESRTSTVRASVAHAAPELIDGLRHAQDKLLRFVLQLTHRVLGEHCRTVLHVDVLDHQAQRVERLPPLVGDGTDHLAHRRQA